MIALANHGPIRSVDATTRDFEPLASNMTFARLVIAAVSNSPIPDSTGSGLPPRQVAQGLVQYYISNMYSLFPFLQETSILTTLDEIYQDRIIKDLDYWVVYMVLAIASTAQSRAFNDEYYLNGVDFASQALDFADHAFAPGYVTQIQSLLLLTQYSMLDPTHFHAWHLIGFTTRAVVDLGLHQDPPTSSVSDKNVLNLRRKIFYCAYALDRLVKHSSAVIDAALWLGLG